MSNARMTSPVLDRGVRLGAVSLVLCLGACGDDSTDSASQTSTTPTTVPSTDPTNTPPTSAGPDGTDTGGSATGTATGTATEPGDPTSASAATPGTDDTGPATQADTGETTAGVLTTTSPTTLSTGPDEPTCGDGLVDVGEECDDGNDNPSDTCSNTCTKVPCDQQEGNPQELLSFIWIANSSQGTVSKIETLSAAKSGVYGRIQRVA